MITRGQNRRETIIICYILYAIIRTAFYIKSTMPGDEYFMELFGLGIVAIMLTMLEFKRDDETDEKKLII